MHTHTHTSTLQTRVGTLACMYTQHTCARTGVCTGAWLHVCTHAHHKGGQQGPVKGVLGLPEPQVPLTRNKPQWRCFSDHRFCECFHTQ